MIHSCRNIVITERRKAVKRRFIHFFILAFAILVIALPTYAGNNYAAKIGTTQYTKFEKALHAVKQDEKITLLKNCTIKRYSFDFCKKRNITIDLNRHTLTWGMLAPNNIYKSSITFINGTLKIRSLEINGSSKVTFKNCTIRGLRGANSGNIDMAERRTKVTFNNCKCSGFDIQVYGGASLSVNGGRMNILDQFQNKGGIVTFKGATVVGQITNLDPEATYVTVPLFRGSEVKLKKVPAYENGKMTIISGTFKPRTDQYANNRYTFLNDGALIIRGGTIDYTASSSSYGYTNAIKNSGTLTIKGGTVVMTDKSKYTSFKENSYGKNNVIDNAGGTIVMSGGTLQCNNGSAILNNSGTVRRTGGTIIVDNGFPEVYKVKSSV